MVDDQEFRHAPLKPAPKDVKVFHCYDAPKAIATLKKEGILDLVSIDYNLGITTGMSVVDYIIKMPPEKRPKEIRIHTGSLQRASEMVNKLIDAGCENVHYDNHILFGENCLLELEEG